MLTRKSKLSAQMASELDVFSSLAVIREQGLQEMIIIDPEDTEKFVNLFEDP